LPLLPIFVAIPLPMPLLIGFVLSSFMHRTALFLCMHRPVPLDAVNPRLPCAYLCPEPRQPVPVPGSLPFLPVSCKVGIMYPVVTCRDVQRICGRYCDYDWRHCRKLYRNPCLAAERRAVPIALIISVPNALVKVHPLRAWHHVHILTATGDNYQIRLGIVLHYWRRGNWSHYHGGRRWHSYIDIDIDARPC